MSTQTKTLFIDFGALRQHFGKLEDQKKDSEIEFLHHVNRGLRGEITKLNKKIKLKN